MFARLIVILALDFLVGAGTAHAQSDSVEPLTSDRSYKLLREDEDWSFLRDPARRNHGHAHGIRHARQQREQPHQPLLRVLRAVADDTRLRILRLVAERPRTTQELGPLVGLSRAGLSKSLLRLAEAGLVVPRREGYYVVYSLAPERLDALADALRRFLA